MSPELERQLVSSVLERGFRAYPRRDGRPGIRNLALVLSAELSCNSWVRETVEKLNRSGTPACGIVHKQGLGNFRIDLDTFLRVMKGIVTHPNVGAVLLICSGNENYDPSVLVNESVESGRLAASISPRSVSPVLLPRRSSEIVLSFANELAGSERRTCAVADLTVGLNCAGTDVTSAQTSNLVCGRVMDHLVRLGARVVLSETPELVGLEEALYGRCVDIDTANALRSAVERQAAYLTSDGGDATANEFCAFNHEGGLETLRQKAEISVLKGGSSPISALIGYGQQTEAKGLCVMDGPAMSDFVISGLLGHGAQLMVNCCGSGPANTMPFVVGADGPAALLPVIKCSGGSAFARDPANRIDVDAGGLLAQPGAIETVAESLAIRILDTASGTATATERDPVFWMNLPLKYHQA